MVLVEQSDSIGNSQRTTCRRCRAKLVAPASSALSAFCCKGCVRLHYRAKCVICEGRKSRKGLACNHPRCQSELAAKKRHDALGMVWGSGRAKLGSADPIKIGVPERAKGDRPCCIVTGSLTPNQLRLATVGTGTPDCPFAFDRKLSRRRWIEAEACGSFEDAEWCEAISSDGVRCFVADAAP
jgi:hypothetical protein